MPLLVLWYGGGLSTSGDLLVQPSRRVHFVALQGARVGVDTCKLDVVAEVVSPFEAEVASAARNAGFYCHAIACVYMIQLLLLR